MICVIVPVLCYNRCSIFYQNNLLHFLTKYFRVPNEILHSVKIYAIVLIKFLKFGIIGAI